MGKCFNYSIDCCQKICFCYKKISLRRWIIRSELTILVGATIKEINIVLWENERNEVFTESYSPRLMEGLLQWWQTKLICQNIIQALATMVFRVAKSRWHKSCKRVDLRQILFQTKKLVFSSVSCFISRKSVGTRNYIAKFGLRKVQYFDKEDCISR